MFYIIFSIYIAYCCSFVCRYNYIALDKRGIQLTIFLIQENIMWVLSGSASARHVNEHYENTPIQIY